MEELELTDEMLERNDKIYGAVHECINILAETEEDWDIFVINEVTEAIKKVLNTLNIKVRHPSVVTNEDGSQSYEEYD